MDCGKNACIYAMVHKNDRRNNEEREKAIDIYEIKSDYTGQEAATGIDRTHAILRRMCLPSPHHDLYPTASRRSFTQ